MEKIRYFILEPLTGLVVSCALAFVLLVPTVLILMAIFVFGIPFATFYCIKTDKKELIKNLLSFSKEVIAELEDKLQS